MLLPFSQWDLSSQECTFWSIKKFDDHFAVLAILFNRLQCVDYHMNICDHILVLIR